MLKEYEDEYRLTRPPPPVQRMLLAVLAPLGKLLGTGSDTRITATRGNRRTPGSEGV
jgi:hypothetical protein